MNLVLDSILLVALVLFGVGGILRGPRPEVVTLVGLLLGTLLADEWGAAWGVDLAGAVGVLNAPTAGIIVRGLLFLLPLLALGYGGAMLLPKEGVLGFRSRIGGLALGLFNGAAILAVLLRNWYYSYDAGKSLAEDPATRTLLEWAGWWPLVLALGGLLAVIVATVRRPRRPSAPMIVKQPVAVTGSSGVTTTRPATAPAAATGSGMGSSLPALPIRPVSDPVTPATIVPATTPITPKPTLAGRADGPRCRTCGNALAPGAAFCPNCGTPV